MRILYLGSESGTSGYRASALRRLGHEVTVMCPELMVAGLPLLGPWQRFLGSVGLASFVESHVLRAIRGQTFDLAWVDGGVLVSGSLVRSLQRLHMRVVNYNHDDPYGLRDTNLWMQYKRAVSAYDLVVVVREENVGEAERLGARKVLHVFRSADEVAHAPRVLTAEEKSKWGSEVLFVGTAFPERGPFFAELIRLGVPVSIYGSKWQELKEWKAIQAHWKGPGLEDAYSYGNWILAAKVCLGLLSTRNRDLHTTRTMEIPSFGGLFCAQRTREHLALYKEGEEAVFFDDPHECAAKCFVLLSDVERRQSISRQGHERFLKNGWTNMHVAGMVLKAALE